MSNLKNLLLSWLTRTLLPTTRVGTTLTLDKQLHLYENGTKLSQQELLLLQQEVKFLEQSKLWAYLNSNPEKICQDLIFVKSQTLTDLTIGKTILYTLDIQKNILKDIKKAKGT